MMFAGKVSLLFDTVKHGLKSLVPILILFLYTLIGAVIFMAIEGPNESYELENLKEQRERLLEDTAFRLNTIKSMTPIQAYNHTVSTLIRYRDMLGVADVQTNATRWNIWGAIYFSMTVYTTIGYGNIVPITSTGRVLTIIYAFIGIPLTLITLIALGSLFARICMYIWKLIARWLGCFSKQLERKMTRLGAQDEVASTTESENDSEELLQFPVGFLIGVTIFWIFFCAYVFLLWEETWTYGLSLYFVLISFTTIGFGDVIPSKSNYMILVGIMLLVGLSLVSTVLTIIQKQIHALADDMKGKIDKDYQTALEQADEDSGGVGQFGARAGSIECIDAQEQYGQEAVEDGKPRDIRQPEKRQLGDVIARMPLRSRMLYHVMPADKRKQLARHAKNRHNFAVKGVQTDAWLMENNMVISENTNY